MMYETDYRRLPIGFAKNPTVAPRSQSAVSALVSLPPNGVPPNDQLVTSAKLTYIASNLVRMPT